MLIRILIEDCYVDRMINVDSDMIEDWILIEGCLQIV